MPKSPQPARVLIVEDVAPHARFLTGAIERLDGFELVEGSPASNFADALAAFDRGPIDLVLLDLGIPMMASASTAPSYDDGVSLGELITKKFPETKIAICTTNKELNAVSRSKAFSSVILEKQALFGEDADVLAGALKAALSGATLYLARDEETHGHEEILRYGFTGAGRGASPRNSKEWEVISLLHDGLTNEEIAAELYLSVRTVETHLHSIGTKVAAAEGLPISKKQGQSAPEYARWYAQTRFKPPQPKYDGSPF